jgi:hypothetical protein
LLATPGLLVSAAVWLILGPLTALAAALVCAALTAAWVWSQGLLALRAVGAGRGGLPVPGRLANLAAGLSADLGVDVPEVRVFESGGASALLCPVAGRAVLACSTGLLDTLTRTELEGVVAHLLMRGRDRGRTALVMGAALGRAGGELAGPLPADDVRAAATTRYPVALASAIVKATPWRGRGAQLHLAPARPVPPAERARALREL